MLSSLVFILVVLPLVIGDITNSLYTNYLTQVGSSFGTQQTIAQFTVSLEMLGHSISGLVYGPMSDRYGRRPTMILGMAIFSIAGLGCCIAGSITSLIVARFFYGVGAGVAAVVGCAVICDTYSSEECYKGISLMYMSAVTFSTFVGPVVTNYMMAHEHGWRAVFVLSCALSMALLLWFVLKFPETISERCAAFNPASVISGYVALLKNRGFLAYCLIKGLTLTCIIASFGSLPFVFIEGMGLQAKYYGYVSAIGGISFIVGTMANIRLVRRFGMYRMIATGLIATVVSDVILVIMHCCITLTPVIAEIIWLPSSFCLSFITSNSVALALQEVKHKGIASALIIFCQTVFGALGMYVVGALYNGTVVPLAVLSATCTAVSLVILYRIVPGDVRHKFSRGAT
ncbi:MFS transporter [Anaplasma capra]|uniref:MFS transporter n=1 Tax=Anaplasma capra TaxID=1562740 RepID=UPI0021D5C26F|nr:MFS transporter [Anaplasma capra]MCU7611710.1 MFS transporter [Anaplasma capra]MCU7612539.1 MFS transporter [Anaplasma capra]